MDYGVLLGLVVVLAASASAFSLNTCWNYISPVTHAVMIPPNFFTRLPHGGLIAGYNATTTIGKNVFTSPSGPYDSLCQLNGVQVDCASLVSVG